MARDGGEFPTTHARGGGIDAARRSTMTSKWLECVGVLRQWRPASQDPQPFVDAQHAEVLTELWLDFQRIVPWLQPAVARHDRHALKAIGRYERPFGWCHDAPGGV
ncbi:MAG: hypothetical protein RLZZ386_1620, partial [Planctomycetota bacterium]